MFALNRWSGSVSGCYFILKRWIWESVSVHRHASPPTDIGVYAYKSVK